MLLVKSSTISAIATHSTPFLFIDLLDESLVDQQNMLSTTDIWMSRHGKDELVAFATEVIRVVLLIRSVVFLLESISVHSSLVRRKYA